VDEDERREESDHFGGGGALRSVAPDAAYALFFEAARFREAPVP
jgi:hypothetical protein